MPDDEDPKHDDTPSEQPKKDEPKANWGSRLGALGRGFQKAIKDASESETGKQIKVALAEVGPQMKKAAQAIGPELKKVVEQVRPDVERAVNQLRPEVDRIVGEAKPVIEGALNDLLGRDKPPTPPAGKSSAPPNVSPDAIPVADDDDDEHTRPDAFATNRRDAGSNADDDAPPEPTPRAPSKTIGRKTPRKGGKGSTS